MGTGAETVGRPWVQVLKGLRPVFRTAAACGSWARSKLGVGFVQWLMDHMESVGGANSRNGCTDRVETSEPVIGGM